MFCGNLKKDISVCKLPTLFEFAYICHLLLHRKGGVVCRIMCCALHHGMCRDIQFYKPSRPSLHRTGLLEQNMYSELFYPRWHLSLDVGGENALRAGKMRIFVKEKRFDCRCVLLLPVCHAVFRVF